MPKVEELLNEIKSLKTKDKQKIYQTLREDLINKKVNSIDLSKYRGVARNVWDKDAQHYIAELRGDDRNNFDW
ncbi:MAG: hypothetical protein ACE5HO_21020 [bacterium]